MSEAAQRSPLETGGVLLGYDGEGGDIVVTAVVGPGPNAVHSHGSFVPDHTYHELEVARLYAASGRRHVYLGDWHSHPGGSCALSKRDRRTLRRIARAPAARVSEPLMLVVGGQDEYWQIRAYQLTRDRFYRKMRSLEIVRFGKQGDAATAFPDDRFGGMS